MLYNDLLIEILVHCNMSIIINFSLINKKSYIVFINNKNYIGIRKLKNLLLINDFNRDKEYNYFDIYSKLINYKNKNDAIRISASNGHLEIVNYLKTLEKI